MRRVLFVERGLLSMRIGNEKIDLGLMLIDSAQCFRWTRAGDAFGAVLNRESVWLVQDECGVIAEGGECALLRDYLDLNRDYAAIAREYEAIPIVRSAIESHPGLRVLNQPPWEALVSFILSANNNVSRIRKLCLALQTHLGERFDTPRGALFAMPGPERLANCPEETLRALGTGYRAPYLIRTARRVADGFDLNALSSMEYAEAHRRLIKLPGVGDKVADCVLLFGCRHSEALPVDVWMARLIAGWLGEREANRTLLARRAREILGKNAGIAQQFLFHAARMGEISG